MQQAEVLELVLTTGRCRWRSLEGPMMALGVPRRGRIGWAMLDNGSQKAAVPSMAAAPPFA